MALPLTLAITGFSISMIDLVGAVHALGEVPVVAGRVAGGLGRALRRQEEGVVGAGDDDDAHAVVVAQLGERRADLDMRAGQRLAVLRLDGEVAIWPLRVTVMVLNAGMVLSLAKLAVIRSRRIGLSKIRSGIAREARNDMRRSMPARRRLRCLAVVARPLGRRQGGRRVLRQAHRHHRGRLQPGGNYDLYARLVSRHIGKHIPGNPTVIVQNMPGAGSRRLANTLANVGPHDGTMIGLPNQGIAMDQALGTEGVKFDARKFNWIGSPVEDNNVFWGWHTNPVKTIEDAQRARIRRRRDRARARRRPTIRAS